jgi:2-hydroxy-6-oxonona-2,4-dienedioate hydrolase
MRLRNRIVIAVIVVAAVALGASYAAYRQALAAARERLADGSAIVETRCGAIEYAAVGDGMPVLVIHGAGGGFDQGLELGRGLVARGYRVIAPSRFGYLRTPLAGDASAEAQADAHACLLDALGIARAAVLGVSAGGPSALQVALRHPQRTAALVLLVPAAYVPRDGALPSLQTPPGTRFLFDTALRLDFLFWAATRAAPRTMGRAILATPPAVLDAASAEEQRRVERILDDILPVSARRLGLLNDAFVTTNLERYELERIAAPTLVVTARDDLYGTYDTGKYTADHIANARFIGFASGGHVLVGHQTEADDEIAAFLRPTQPAVSPRAAD